MSSRASAGPQDPCRSTREHLDLELPEDPGTGRTAPDDSRRWDLRSDIARWLPPHKLPEDRAALLEFLQHEGAPDDVTGAIPSLPARRKFATIGEIVRALGIPYEED